MTLQEAMRARHMVRKYTDKPLPQDVVEQLQQRINENNEKLHLDIRLMINDTKPIRYECWQLRFWGVWLRIMMKPFVS